MTPPVATAKPAVTVLAVGAGRRRTVADYGFMGPDGQRVADDAVRLITLDMMQEAEPDIICELGSDRIDLPDDEIDLVVAIHVLEHIGTAGKTDEWFKAWEEMYRVLKPGGVVEFECPYYSSLWAWADPTHLRPISEATFLYLDQNAYRVRPSAIPAYHLKADFVPVRGGKPCGVHEAFDLTPDTTNDWVREREAVSNIRGRLAARKPFKGWWEDA